MKVLHVVPSLSPLRGGPSASLPIIVRCLAHRNVEVHVATTDDDGPGRLRVPVARAVRHEGTTTWYFPRQTRFYTFSWPLTRWLLRHAPDYDLLHLHALFSYPTVSASWAAAQHGVPYIVRPLGTLNRWGMSHRRPRLKRLSFHLIERRILAGAAAVHYTSDLERMEAQQLGVNAPAAIIPLGIEPQAFTEPASPERFLQAHPALAGRTVILFLSRLDPKKGLDILLPAFARVRQACPEAILVLAGDGKEEFAASLRDEAGRLGVDGHTIFAGFLRGHDKLSALAAASAFVLPSYSENFGMAAVEAMAAGLPVVLSDQVGISPDVRRAEAGLVVAPEVDAVAVALECLVANPALRQRLGENARRLTRDRYTAAATARELDSLYRQALTRRANYHA